MIEPFFFDNDRLFGCYSASTDHASDTVVVICPPLFDEYRRTYRALSELSLAIAEQGTHAFRLDYYGTAESQGLLSEATLDGWVSDIHKAIDEAMDVSGAEKVTLLGVRFGATLAAQVDHPAIRARVFWDPVVSGRNYQDWLEEVDRILHDRHLSSARENNVPFEDISYRNFELPESLAAGMARISIPDGLLNQPGATFVVSTDPGFCKSLANGNCVFTGLVYDWPYYHDGVITQKPVLEALLEQIAR
jgi:alpha/beta superfamily hydrolase